METASLTVVVPTRERPEALARCLAALRHQTASVEVIVVEDTQGRGPAWARNEGARSARGDLVLFCDDDCAPDPDWAERLSAACRRGGSAAGETVNDVPGDRVAAASQLLTSSLQRLSLRRNGTLGFAPSSNLAVSRDLLERVPFDEGFPLAAGEDREWCARAGAAGGAPVFVPGAVVRHRPDLGGLGGFWRQQVRYGRGAALLRARGVALAGPSRRLELMRSGLDEGMPVGALVLFAQVGVAVGYAAERLHPGSKQPNVPRHRDGAV